jgi:hypothetical protein
LCRIRRTERFHFLGPCAAPDAGQQATRTLWGNHAHPDHCGRSSGALALSVAAHAATGNAVIAKVVVNGGKPLAVGITPKALTISATGTVSGKLTLADWEAGAYAGSKDNPVKLQFRKKGSSAYTTVKTVRTGAAGALKTTVKASVDGYHRFAYAGTTSASALN